MPTPQLNTGRVLDGDPGDLEQYKQEFRTHSNNLENIFDALYTKASEAGGREDQLSREIALWKDSYMRSEKRNSELERQIIDLKLETSSASSGGGPPFAVVLLDGDGLIFSAALLSQGADGGRLAAQALRERVRQGLEGNLAGVSGSFNIVIHVYMNKDGLGRALIKSGKVVGGVFDKFVITGFINAHEYNSVVDVGYGKEASDTKVREGLRFFLDIPQCKLVLLGASHDNGYSGVLHSLSSEGKIDRVLILKGYTALAYELRTFQNRVVDIPGLFMSEKLSTLNVTLADAITAQATPDQEDVILFTTTSQPSSTSAKPKKAKGLPSQLAQDKETADSPTDSSGEGKFVPPNKGKVVSGSVKDLNPRPCHSYYLLGRACVKDCEWGHDYKLTAEQLNELRGLVKRMPCPFWLKGICSHDDDCIYGHKCNLGDNCTFGNKCKFMKWHQERQRY